MAEDDKTTPGVSRRELVRRAGLGAGGLLLSGIAAEPIWARPKVHDASNESA